jgi:hypothetical protein
MNPWGQKENERKDENLARGNLIFTKNANY